MKLFVVNAGSSSMKFRLFEKDNLNVLADGIIERIGLKSNFIIEYGDKELEIQHDLADHLDAATFLNNKLIELGIINDLSEIKGVGHRVVQGGEHFKDSSLVEEKELAIIKDLSKLAPLHNPGASAVIKAFMDLIPEAKNVAVFDTAYHQTIPYVNYRYAVPTEWLEKYGVRKYGAHGTSHYFMAKRVEEILNKDKVNIISCHLGNGASITAIKDSKSVDTSMGLTPLAGIVMGTRSGDIDPSIHAYVASQTGMGVQEITNKLNSESGILALSGVSNDFRDVTEAAKTNQVAKDAMEIYAKRVADYIVKYQNELESKIDAIVFTAGIGENSSVIRELILNNLHTMDIEVNKEVNNTRTKESFMKISTENSKVPAYMIKTDEELVIVKDLIRITNL